MREFKVGDRVIPSKQGLEDYLGEGLITEGKVYTVINNPDSWMQFSRIRVISDNGTSYWSSVDSVFEHYVEANIGGELL